MPRASHVRPVPQRAFYAHCEEYHAVAKPMLKPIKRAKFGLPAKLYQEQREVVQLGPLLAGLHPIVPDNGYQNFLSAFRKRCNYFSAERASPLIISSSLDLINRLVPNALPEFNWNRGLVEPWLARFDPEKRLRMEVAMTNLCNKTDWDYSSKDLFVKTEALLVGHKPNWAPRVIYKGTDLYNAISGPMFQELMGRFDQSCSRMQGDFQVRVAYKKIPTQYTPFISGGVGGEYVESDFSANDMKQCSDVMLLEMALMRRLGAPEWFVRLHSRTNQFEVHSREHRTKATLENQLPTGVTDTTFRNTFWNMSILYAFFIKTRITRCRAVLLGDDMLARVTGLQRHAVRTYENIAAEARMDAKVARHRYLHECGFLSKSFIPRQNGVHLTVPLLGKALGRFNMRANRNSAVTDHAYMAGKSVGYAYEFRYVPDLRDIFMDRFLHEWEHVQLEKRKLSEEALNDGLTWNARQSGITLRNIQDKIRVPEVLLDSDFMAFCYVRYGVTSTDVIELFERVVLSVGCCGGEIEDASDVVSTLLAVDFLGS